MVVLSVNEMPAHTHTFAQREIVNDAAEVCGGENITVNGNNRITERTGSTGGNQPHNNIQPYITVYMWRRIG